MDEKIELLLRSYDCHLPAEDEKQLKHWLETSPELRHEKEKLDQVRRKMANWSAEFKPGFTKRLMHQIANDTPLVFQSVFRFVFFSGVAAIVLILLSVYFADGSLNIDSLLGINRYAPDLGMLSMF